MKKMSYDRIGNTHIRENGKKRNIFSKVNEIKRDLKELLKYLEKKKAKKPQWFLKYKKKLIGEDK